MTLNELSNALKELYHSAPAGEQTTMIHLFCIRYADEIKSGNYLPKDILKSAEMSASYVTEINKGIRLARYVDERHS